MSFLAANSAVEAAWVSKALSDGDWGKVSGVVPSAFEAYVAVRHPAWLCDCTEENLAGLRSGYECGRPIRWAEVAQSEVPVVYGYVSHTKRRRMLTRRTQFRRLQGGGWILDELPGHDLIPQLRPGDTWITGPREGSLEPDLARVLQSVLGHETTDSVPCWFGIWEGFGSLTEAQRAAPSIEAPGRRWHLFRAPLDHLERSFEDGFGHQPANLAWPEDRSWCLATEIDAEVTYVGGSKDLISAILEEPGLESVPAGLDERLARLSDVLTPVVDKPADASVPPGFESRDYPPEYHRLQQQHRFGIAKSWMYRLLLWLNPSWRREYKELIRSGQFVSNWGRTRRDKRDCSASTRMRSVLILIVAGYATEDHRPVGARDRSCKAHLLYSPTDRFPRSADVMPFEPYLSEFSVANAAMMAELARAVYLSDDEGAPDAEAILEELKAGDGGFQSVWPFDRGSSQACVVVHEDFICAAFRGTNELADWRDNVQVGKVKGPFGRVHRGFQAALMDVWPAMKARLASYAQRPLWLTGHSLGGAMATLAAAQLADADESFIGVYTFGSPRCGGRQFSRIYEIEAGARSHRVHNNSDIVTRFPTRQMNYRHVGRLAYITQGGEIKHDTGWWYRFCNRVRGAALDLGEAGLDAVKDHGIGEYAQAIGNATTHTVFVSQPPSP